MLKHGELKMIKSLSLSILYWRRGLKSKQHFTTEISSLIRETVHVWISVFITFEIVKSRKFWKYSMATALDLSSLGNFDPYSDPTTLSLRWKEWLRRYERFLVAMDIKDDTRKRALLLYAGGNEVEKVFATLSDVGEDKDYKKAVEKLNE